MVATQLPVEEKTTQVKVRKGFVVEGRSPGTVFFTTPSRAREFLKQNAVDIIGGKVPGLGPTTAEPSPASSTAPASSGSPTTSRSTASQSSSAGGKEQPSPSSEEARASTKKRAGSSKKRIGKGASSQSPSTTRIKLRRGRK